MILELTIQLLMNYKVFLMSNFPYILIALAMASDTNIKHFLWALAISTVVFQFIPAIETLREVEALNRLDNVKSSKDIEDICKANATTKKKPRRAYAYTESNNY